MTHINRQIRPVHIAIGFDIRAAAKGLGILGRVNKPLSPGPAYSPDIFWRQRARFSRTVKVLGWSLPKLVSNISNARV